MKNTIRQLRHRNVFRATVSYLVAGWIILQVGDLLFPLLGLSEAALRAVFITLLVLLPVWIFLAFRYEWTPEGFQRTSPLLTGEAEGGVTGRWTNAFIIGGMGVAIVLLVVDRIFNVPGFDDLAEPAVLSEITTTRSYNYSSTWSPDGSMLAYADRREGFDLWIRTTDDFSSGRELTSHADDEFLPRWSNDGSRIAFISDRGSGTDIYWISPSGGPERLIASTNLHELEHIFEMLASLGSRPWSPDDSRFIFSKRVGNSISIWEVELETGEERQVTQPQVNQKDLSASWSPDGSEILFQRGTNIWIKSSDGDEYVLLEDDHTNYQPVWGSTSETVLFISDRSGSHNVWQLDRSDNSLEQITSTPTAMATWDPSVSNGGRLAFTEFNHDTDLILLDLESGEETRLTYHIGNNFHPRFSHDGRRILYQSDRTGNLEIWLLDLYAGQDVQITSDPGVDILPDWSPDGNRYAFLSNRSGGFHLWIGEVDRRTATRITEQPVLLPNFLIDYSLSVRWAPGGNTIGYIALGERDRALWTINPDGTEHRIALENLHSFDWYMDDETILFNRIDKGDTLGTGLWIRNLRTGAEKLLYPGYHLTEITTLPGGNGIGFGQSNSHWSQAFFVLDLDTDNLDEHGFPTVTGEPRRLTRDDVPWHVHHGIWSPGGDSLVYVRDIDEGNIVEVSNRRF